ncbi:unnamed protein product [Urochloa humidicola]
MERFYTFTRSSQRGSRQPPETPEPWRRELDGRCTVIGGSAVQLAFNIANSVQLAFLQLEKTAVIHIFHYSKTSILSSFTFVAPGWYKHPHEHQNGKASNRNSVCKCLNS